MWLLDYVQRKEVREEPLKKTTKFEQIQTMTIDELVNFIGECGHDFPPYCDYKKASEATCDQNCRNCCKKWLESEVD